MANLNFFRTLSLSAVMLVAACGGQDETALRLDEAIDDTSVAVEVSQNGEARTDTEEQLQAGRDAPPSAGQATREQGEELERDLREGLGLGN